MSSAIMSSNAANCTAQRDVFARSSPSPPLPQYHTPPASVAAVAAIEEVPRTKSYIHSVYLLAQESVVSD